MKLSTSCIIATFVCIILNFIYPTIEYRTASIIFSGMILIEMVRENK